MYSCTETYWIEEKSSVKYMLVYFSAHYADNDITVFERV
jgi:hypothetical protein